MGRDEKRARRARRGWVRGLCIWLVLAAAAAAPPARATAKLPPITVTANTALLVDSDSGEVLFEKNIRERAYPASLTKIMTALLALERGKLDDLLTASATAFADMVPGGSTQNIQEGEVMTLENYLYCALISSANEACNVIAEYVSGSVEAFVALMNERAAQLGCENTQFVNTHGLPDENHYTTAWDIYLITREAMKHPEFMIICNTAAKAIPPTNKWEKERALYTTNHLISNNTERQYLYYPAKGIKTGHTNAAGYCLVSSAEKNGLYFISVVMGAREEEETKRILSFVETAELFEWGFANFSVKPLLKTTEQIREVVVEKGKEKDSVMLVPQKNLEALVPNDLEASDVDRKITPNFEGAVTAPVTRGQVLGTISLRYGDREFGTVALVASSDVERDEAQQVAEDFRNFFDRDWVKYTMAGVAALLILYVVFVIVYNARRRRARMRGNYRGNRRRQHRRR
ncbi:MAG: D-alanyl-D-alanine carboxypeptidase [Oscillospiraceae bacterium]|jgi:D-alanyl-D-alanine carboxypeptidase (penicillin-binding protein 5/6)|nr:D-alanyl-D-alanine carboxypeptidase [Oscillospiraceae bacterium]